MHWPVVALHESAVAAFPSSQLTVRSTHWPVADEHACGLHGVAFGHLSVVYVQLPALHVSLVHGLPSSHLTGDGWQPFATLHTYGVHRSVVLHTTVARTHCAVPLEPSHLSSVHALLSSHDTGAGTHELFPLLHAMGLHGSVHVHACEPHDTQFGIGVLRHVPFAMHESTVHGLLSLHVLFENTHPAIVSQLPTWHGSDGTQVISVCEQLPALQLSLVHALESLQFTGIATHPFTLSHEIGAQGSPAAHTCGVLWHTAAPLVLLQ